MIAVSRQKAAVSIPRGTSFDDYLTMAMPSDIEAETELDTEGKPEREKFWFKKAARVSKEVGYIVWKVEGLWSEVQAEDLST